MGKDGKMHEEETTVEKGWWVASPMVVETPNR